ncbi:chemotaxis protein CheC [Methanococcus voltae]|uniref:Chemotaxis protein CheC n=2 Tax=Methanococcus voltae TaxID=2188 RepID=A0A8J7USW7_METVO|nr:chemotaxis protein CheC [Methanococcus voltae]MBP2172022.1 chemotaxis protein CheC [Methanococcus voltae]MBP2201023.1 chemotaxis protein CheC [Methanococcus voltae]MCS3921745.1 chemotaxis protein CheC [Methanococcus voltae PS]
MFSKEQWLEILKTIIEEELGGEIIIDLENPKKGGPIKDFSSLETIGKAAATRAASFVMDMSGEDVDVNVFKIKLTSLNKLLSEASEDKKVFTKIDFNGMLSGMGVLIFTEKDAIKMGDSMLKGMFMEDPEVDVLSELKISAINETCNLLVSAFVDTFANYMETSLSMTPPNYCVNDMASFLNEALKDYDINNDDLIFTFESELVSKGIDSSFEVFMAMNPESTAKLSEKLE